MSVSPNSSPVPDLLDFAEPERQQWHGTFNSLGAALEEVLREGHAVADVYEGRGMRPNGCSWCHKALPNQKLLRCSRCKSVVYCGAQCNRDAWHNARDPDPPHKEVCAMNKKYMERVPAVNETLSSFPWGLVDKDGTFNIALARGRYGVDGGTGTGFWSQRSGVLEFENEGDIADRERKYASEQYRRWQAIFGHLDGDDLLCRAGHLSDEEGWRLDNSLVPYCDLQRLASHRWPELITDYKSDVTDWDHWYRWRKLPKRSPAALLMSWPLSVYHLLVRTLRVTHARAGTPSKRIPLIVYLLGAAIELNFLPLFSELAMILPYHDIKLVLIGPAVYKLCEVKDSAHPGSPLREDSMHIFQYKAPDALGGGTLKIELFGSTPLLDETAFTTEIFLKRKDIIPHAMIALNAGLMLYESWNSVISLASQMGIAFAVTEYTEQAADLAASDKMPYVTGLPRSAESKVDLNPFHRPGQRAIPYFLIPNLSNGFTFVVTPCSRKTT